MRNFKFRKNLYFSLKLFLRCKIVVSVKMKYSKQKDEMLKLLRSGRLNHPCAAEVYAEMKRIMPEIGIATVYRNLNVLVEAGLLLRLTLAGEPDRFDFRLDSHNHAICDKCGEVFDFECSSIGDISKKLLQDNDFKVTTTNIFVRGLCKKCRGACEVKN